MAMLLYYVLEGGAIQGIITANTRALLEVQPPPQQPTHATMILEGDDPVMHLAPNIVQEQWYIVEGVCVPREELTIVADPNPFPAPGGDKCSVTVTPFVPCTLLVNDTPYALTEADPTLELGASVPTTFLIFLQELTGYWATPLAIQAM